MKRLNATTGKPFNRGDNREDGFFFLGYQTRKNKQGFFYESWASPQLWKNQTVGERNTFEKHISRSYAHIKSRSKKENIPFTVSLDYLKSIATDTCPALKIKLSWSQPGKTDNSPSLDKIIPELGYVEGNVMWLSNKANRMKNNATKGELKKFAEWILNGHIGNTKGVNP